MMPRSQRCAGWLSSADDSTSRSHLQRIVGRLRDKLHLNPVPLQEIYERSIAKFEKPRLEALSDLRRRLEKPIARSTFVYVTYIRTTPEKLWSALTEAEFIKQYWFGNHCESQWTVGVLVEECVPRWPHQRRRRCRAATTVSDPLAA
jgi:hypothetical protein